MEMAESQILEAELKMKFWLLKLSDSDIRKTISTATSNIPEKTKHEIKLLHCIMKVEREVDNLFFKFVR